MTDNVISIFSSKVISLHELQRRAPALDDRLPTLIDATAAYVSDQFMIPRFRELALDGVEALFEANGNQTCGIWVKAEDNGGHQKGREYFLSQNSIGVFGAAQQFRRLDMEYKSIARTAFAQAKDILKSCRDYRPEVEANKLRPLFLPRYAF